LDRARSRSRLVNFAKELHPNGLDLWTFQGNVGARRFYEQHEFVVLEPTDGAHEEGAPDVHCHPAHIAAVRRSDKRAQHPCLSNIV
jgi:hypothetical protein